MNKQTTKPLIPSFDDADTGRLVRITNSHKT